VFALEQGFADDCSFSTSDADATDDASVEIEEKHTRFVRYSPIVGLSLGAPSTHANRFIFLANLGNDLFYNHAKSTFASDATMSKRLFVGSTLQTAKSIFAQFNDLVEYSVFREKTSIDESLFTIQDFKTTTSNDGRVIAYVSFTHTGTTLIPSTLATPPAIKDVTEVTEIPTVLLATERSEEGYFTNEAAALMAELGLEDKNDNNNDGDEGGKFKGKETSPLELLEEEVLPPTIGMTRVVKHSTGMVSLFLNDDGRVQHLHMDFQNLFH